MEKVVAYKASNGRLFDTEEKCLAYERKMSRYPKVKERIDVAAPFYSLFDGRYKDVDIVRHTIERWEKPSSGKSVEKYFIVGGKYKFVDVSGKHESSVMDGGVFPGGRLSMNWYIAFRHFAEQVLLGNELTDEFVRDEVEKINEVNVSKNGIDDGKLVVNVIEPDRKWEIDNPSWCTGRIAPYTFTMEKIG
jgi:hypothetical protein